MNTPRRLSSYLTIAASLGTLSAILLAPLACRSGSQSKPVVQTGGPVHHAEERPSAQAEAPVAAVESTPVEVAYDTRTGQSTILRTETVTRPTDADRGQWGEAEEGEAATEAEGLARERFLKRAGPDGTIPPNALLNAKRAMDAVPALRLPAGGQRDAGIWDWEWLGPGDIGGRVRSIAISPTSPDTIWVGAVSGGIWKTTNGGDSWTPVNDFLPSLAVSSIVINPTNPNIMYAATGEGIFGGNTHAMPGAGVFVSTDGGGTWQPIPSTVPTNPDPTQDPWGYVNRLAVSPNGTTVLAATNSGVYRTTNGGITWPATNLGGGRVLDVKFLPGDSNRALASASSGLAFYSSDGGATWSQSTFLLPIYATSIAANTSPDANTDNDDYLTVQGSSTNFGQRDRISIGGASPEIVVVQQSIPGPDYALLRVSDMASPHSAGDPVETLLNGRIELAVTPAVPSRVLASMDVAEGLVWVSGNYGQTYAILATPENTPNYLGHQGGYDNAIWCSPDDPDLIVVGGLDLWRTDDFGTTWDRISDWHQYHNGSDADNAHADQHTIVVPPNYGPDNRRVYVGNDGGVQKASDVTSVGMGGWTNLANGLGITQFYGGAVSADGWIVVGGSQDNDTSVSLPEWNNQHWLQPETGDGGYCAVREDSGWYRVYGEYVNLQIQALNAEPWMGGILYSPWESVTNGLGDAGHADRALFIAPFVLDPNDPLIMVAGGISIWRRTGGTSGFTNIRNAGSTAPRMCSAIDVAVGNSQRIWVGYSDGYVSRTTTSVLTWDNLDENGVDADGDGVAENPLPNGFVTDIAINPNNDQEVFVTFGGYNADSIWFTDDGGATWNPRQGTGANTVPDIQVNTVRFHPLMSSWVYVGTDLGVFASEDRGLNWNRTPRFGDVNHDGPVNVEVSELFWGGEYLYAATFGRGMYRTRPLSFVVVDKANTSGIEDGSLTHPFDSVQEGINAAGNGTVMFIYANPSDYDEPGVTRFDRRGTVYNVGGTVRIR